MSQRITRSLSKKGQTDRKISEFLIMAEGGAAKPSDENQISQLRTLLEQVCSDVKKGNDRNEENFLKLGAEISDIKKKIVSHEVTLGDHATRIQTMESEIKDMTSALNDMNIDSLQKQLEEANDRLRTLEKKELESAIHTRKYNLLIYGIEGKEQDTKITESIVRKFAKEELRIDSELPIANTHRLPKRYQASEKPGPDPIIVKFNNMPARDEFLRATVNIPKHSKARVRTHLPLLLAKERAKLAREGYMRREGGQQARVRERGSAVWLEGRETSKDSWSKLKTVTLDDIVDRKPSVTICASSKV